MTEYRAWIYRLFSSSGQLLYIGLSDSYKNRFRKRLTGHRATRPWWPEVALITAQPYANRFDAAWAEYAAQRDGLPLHNKLARGAPWRSPDAPAVVPLGPPERVLFPLIAHRRHLDTALNLPDQEKRDTDDHSQ